MSLLAQFIRTYSAFLLVSYLTSFTNEVHAQAALDFFEMDQLTTNKPKVVRSTDDMEEKEELSTIATNTSKVFCDFPPKSVLYGELIHEYLIATTFRIGSVVSYKCVTNYVYIPGSVNTSTCMSDGKWSLPDTFCKPNACSSLPRLDNAQPKDSLLGQATFPIGTKVTYNCRPGYIRLYVVKGFAICMDDGTWSPPGNFCTRRSCGNPGEVDNAEMIAESLLFGSRVIYNCNPGYRMLTHRNYRDCLADGTWSNTLPVCEAQLCAQPPNIINGAFYPSKEEYAYLDSVRYSCNRYLSLIGESSISCKEDGQWSSNVPECKVVSCPAPYVTNSRKIAGISGPYSLNSVVRFRCNSGYMLNGSDIIKCNQNSQWEPAAPNCLGVCKDVPVINSARLVEPTSERPFLEGTTLKFMCEAGYVPVPGASNIITCQGPEWAPYPKFCTPISCGDPGSINNGYIVRGSFYFGSDVTYTCNIGYKINDGNKRKCQADGNWSLPIPECKVQTCPSPNVSMETSFIPVKTQYQYADRLKYSCNEGYQLVGELETVCNEKGRWSPSIPFCKRICTAPPELKNAKLLNYYANKTTFFENAKAQYSCINGYTWNEQDIITLTCLGTFEWSDPQEFCERISCGPPEEITNAIYKVEDFLYGSEVVYTCKEGYKMAGNNSRKCLANGNWSYTIPRCEVQTCPPPEDLEDGSYKEKSRYIYQDSVTYKCDKLTLVGKASISCTAEGKWTSGAPECKAVCGSPPELRYGELEKVFLQHQYFNVGTSLKYKCRAGYISDQNKSNEITCLDGLKWSKPDVFCKRRSCNNPGDIVHGQMHFENFLFESRVNYTCDSGYTMISRRNYRYCQADGTWNGTSPVCKASICDNIWELQEEARKCTSTPDEWIKYLQVQYLYLQIENLKLDIEIKKKSAEKKSIPQKDRD